MSRNCVCVWKEVAQCHQLFNKMLFISTYIYTGVKLSKNMRKQ